MNKISFRKFEHMILPQFRQRINEAESTEDVEKSFLHTVVDFSESAFGQRVPVGYEDVNFRPHEKPYFLLSQRLLKDGYFRSIWKNSDLRQVFEGLAGSAMRRYRHLEKRREKRGTKIRIKMPI